MAHFGSSCATKSSIPGITFDDRGAKTPAYKQNQFAELSADRSSFRPIRRKDKTFFFSTTKVAEAASTDADWLYPPSRMENGDFSSLLTSTQVHANLDNPNDQTAPLALDCNNNPTFFGELFDTRQTQLKSGPNYPTGFCGVPFAGNQIASEDPLAQRLTALFPTAGPIDSLSGNNFLANPVLKESALTRRPLRSEILRLRQRFFRFSYEDQPSTIPHLRRRCRWRRLLQRRSKRTPTAA